MKFMKRTLSVVLAVLMLFSTMSVLASATLNDGKQTSVSFDTKFCRYDGSDWVETTKAARGEKIKVRAFLETDFVLSGSLLWYLFDNEQLEFDPSNYSKEGECYRIIGNQGLNILARELESDNINILDLIEYEQVPEEDFKGRSVITIQVNQGAAKKVSFDNYLWEFDFIVKNDASDAANFFVHPGTFVYFDDADTEFNPVYLGKIPDDAADGETMVAEKLTNSIIWQVQPTFYDQDEDSTLTFTNAVKFDAGAGTFAGGASTYTTSEGFIGEALSASDKPVAPTLSGSSFVGWLPSSVDAATATAADCVALEDIKYNYTVDTYTALYEAASTPDPVTYTFDFDANGGAFANSEKTTTVTVNEGETVSVTAPERVGYAFKGWAPATIENPTVDDVVELPAQAAASASYKAVWEKSSYTVNWVVDGETKQTEQVAYGDAIPAAPELTKEGHTLSWSTAPATMPAEALEIVGTWTPKTYTVKWVVNGEEVGETTETYGQPITPYDYTPDDDLMEFDGWNSIPATMPDDENLVIYGSEHFPAPDTYKITFYKDEAKTQEFKSYDLQEGDTIPTVDGPSVKGKTFLGWDLGYTQMPAQALDVAPIFDDIRYTIKFTSPEGSIDENVVTYEAEIVAPDEDDCDVYGYDFDGTWTLNGEPVTFPTTVKALVGDNDAEATFEFVGGFTKKTCYVKFYKNETDIANEIAPYHVISCEFEDEITEDMLPDAPTKKGYTFDDWDSDVTGSAIDEDINVFAMWTAKAYTVIFSGPDSNELSNDSIEYDADITVDFNTDVEGYTFNGKWTYNGTEVTFPTSIETLLSGEEPDGNSVVFVGDYTKKKYTVSFYLDAEAEEPISSVEYAYGTPYSDVVAPSGMKKLGYSFDKWSEDLTDGNVTDNMNIYGIWNAKQYSVIFSNVPDKTVDWSINNLTYDAEISAFDASISGYTFNGWTYNGTTITLPTTVKDIIGENDYLQIIELVGNYVPDKYNVSFYLDNDACEAGEYISQKSYDFGTAISTENIDFPEDPVKPGYVFAGWDYLEGNLLDDDLDIIAKWDNKEYKIRFTGPNEETAAILDRFYYTDGIDFDAPEFEGYTFNKWTYNNKEVTLPTTIERIFDGVEPPDGEIIIVGDYTLNEYTVAFYLDEESKDAGTAISSVKYTYGTPYSDVAVPTPTKLGSTFNGWNPDLADFNTVSESRDFVGTWTAKTYNVTFKGPNGETVTTKQYEYNDVIGDLGDEIEVDGYSFNGKWTYNGAEITSVNTVTVADIIGQNDDTLNIELVGSYTENAKPTYTIKFVDENGGELSSTSYHYNDDITAPDYTAPTGMTFKGWVNAADNTAYTGKAPASSVTYKPDLEWIDYTIKFVDKDGGELSSATYHYGADITAPDSSEVTAPEGMVFTGWADADGNAFTGKAPAASATYHPVFENSNSIAYSIEVYLQNTAGEYELSASTALTGTNGQTVTAQAGTVKGFTLNEDDSVLSATVKGDGTTKLVVKYSRNTYKATFGSDVRNVMYGAALPEVTPDAVTGKEFKGWVDAEGNAAPATMPAENLVLTASWEDIIYTITYVVNESKTVQNYKYGETVVAIADPIVDDMTFLRWSEIVPKTMPAENLTLVAIFETGTGTIDAYTVRFWANDKLFDSRLVMVGAKIDVPTGKPEMDNYVFKGWKNVPSMMPANDLDIYAEFDRVPVVLVPKDSTVTTVIDRDNMLIYGLEERMTKAKYSDYLAVEGDGYFTVTETAHGYGTGTVIKLYDNVTDKCLETYYVVIFGDLNGDAIIDSTDVSIATNEAASVTKWSQKQKYSGGQLVDNDAYVAYMAKAADLNGDGIVSSNDVYLIRDVSLSASTVDQVTGRGTAI